MKFEFFNDTGRLVSIHPGTKTSGIKCDMDSIKPLEARTFLLPPGTYPWVKMWDYGEERGLSIFVSAKKDDTP
ncbi:hypothetical protein PAECIP111891_07063 [Paenibacillus allorhizoplanae]|uniref:Uncharacterized protein n=1 Tax=Paenibacillus allorhizoplanae TaxID=2905648 RepID=A0ABM9D145_9BACL|nr:hypothetical protein [Paenibacillus allorhizoplanae]CAH1232624.1 hypothetical protein PAECIP111891_07063 [Paenibacillus allorhizoplanae]